MLLALYRTRTNFTLLGVAVLVIATASVSILLFNRFDSNGKKEHKSTNLPQIPLFEEEVKKSKSHFAQYSHAAVATDNKQCSEIGKKLLQSGANAVDASIAIALCLGGVNGQSSGLGGGLFMTIYNRSTEECAIVNGWTKSGSLATADSFAGLELEEGQRYIAGWLSAGVPGELHGLRRAWESFGQLSWPQLFQPTIDLLREGFSVSAHTAKHLRDSTVQQNLNNITGLDIYLNPETGLPYNAGERMTRPVYASILELLANSDDPIRLFYYNFSRILLEEFGQEGSNILLRDFEKYQSNIIRNASFQAVSSQHYMCSPALPSSSFLIGTLLQIFQALNYNRQTKELEDLNIHQFIECLKFIFGMRGELGDPNDYRFTTEITNLTGKILTQDWIEHISSLIGNHSFPQEHYLPKFKQSVNHGTASFSVIDSDGNAVSTTSSIFYYFGAQIRSKNLGIIINNALNDFSYPDGPNYFGFQFSPQNGIGPRKQPLSSMSPMIITDMYSGNVELALGGAGGVTILSAISQILLHYLYFNQSLQSAIDAPRLHNQLFPYVTMYELGFSPLSLANLTNNYGQNMAPVNLVLPGLTSIINGIARSRVEGTLTAVCDYRKDGGPDGY